MFPVTVKPLNKGKMPPQIDIFDHYFKKKTIQDKNTHSATQLIKCTVGDGATGLLQSYVSAQHCERPRAWNYVNTHPTI